MNDTRSFEAPPTGEDFVYLAAFQQLVLERSHDLITVVDVLGAKSSLGRCVQDATQSLGRVRTSGQQDAPCPSGPDGLHDRTTAAHGEHIG